jgi:branched-chain amino acid aminotransferase
VWLSTEYVRACPGEITKALRDTLTGRKRGTFADTHGRMARLS